MSKKIKFRSKPITKIIAVIMSVLLIMMLFCSCSSSGIDTKSIVDGVIISKSLTGYYYNFSMLDFENSQIHGVISIESDNIENAINDLQSITAKKPFFGQNSYIILSTRFSADDIMEQLNFFVKSNEISPNTAVMFAGTSVIKNLVQNKRESDYLVGLAKTEKERVKSIDITLMEIITSLNDNNIDKNICLIHSSDDVLYADYAQLCKLF